MASRIIMFTNLYAGNFSLSGSCGSADDSTHSLELYINMGAPDGCISGSGPRWPTEEPRGVVLDERSFLELLLGSPNRDHI